MGRGIGEAAAVGARVDLRGEPAMTWARRSKEVRRSRPATRHGLLRDVRRHPACTSGAVLGLFVYLLIGLGPLWVPAVQRVGLEVCTANGLEVTAVSLPSSGVPAGKTKPKADCPLCRIQTAVLLLPPDGSLAPVDRSASRRLRPAPVATVAGPFAGFDHLSRAPPARS